MTDLLAHVEIVPAAPEHLPWIRATFAHQVRTVPMTTRRQAGDMASALERILRGKLGQAAVACPIGARDAGMGWAVSLDGALLFAYVSDDFRRQGLGVALTAAVVPPGPVCVAFWTRAASDIAAKGFPLVYSINAFRSLCSYVRRSSGHQTSQQRKTA